MPEEEPQYHNNRAFSVPRAKAKQVFSRSSILTGRTPAAFGSTQSMAVAEFGQSASDPTTWPHKWPGAGKTLRMPKTVILSSHPQWTAYWPRCYFYFPRDVIGDSGYGFLNNYYYLDQWNGVDFSSGDGQPDYSWIFDSSYDLGDPFAPFTSDPAYINNPAWSDMKFLTEEDKQSVYNLQKACGASGGGGCDQIPAYLINKCPEPPKEERYQKMVCELQNPYYAIHPMLLDTFIQAKAILENDPVDPIYCIIPNWQPRVMRQTRNAGLKQNHETVNSEHGGAINGQPCDVRDTIPCTTHKEICWAPPYPDPDDPRNKMGFTGPKIPWISSADPGVGTNVLHLYIGHPNMSYIPATAPFDYQAWPLTPEIQWIAGPVGTGTYLGHPIAFLAGRRPVWRATGYDYGFVNHGAVGLYDNRYGPLVEAAADNYKRNFWKFRNFSTQIFTYNASWGFQWEFEKIRDDRRAVCPASAFYFGLDFEEWRQLRGDEDHFTYDCMNAENNPQKLRISETRDFTPPLKDINQAIDVGRRLKDRVEQYYHGIEPGSAEFFQLAIDRTGLGDYNVNYGGTMPGEFFDPGALADYVRSYFSANP